MEGAFILLILFLLWILFAPIVALLKAGTLEQEAKRAREELRGLEERLRAAERELQRLKSESAASPEAPPAVDRPPARAKLPAPAPPPLSEKPAQPIEPPALPPRPEWDAPEPPAPPQTALRLEVREPQEPFSWEKFMGVKLFAWLGGVAMFFGVIFFVKYAFENNLVPPAVRIALGFVTGAGLLAGGLAVHRRPRYKVLAQAFCATGVLILYGVSFAAHAVYHFAAFGPVSTFILMALITVAAFLVAVRLDALVVAVLGMAGGFLTPMLLETDADTGFRLFGYIALLDLGLLAVSRHGRWAFLTSAAVIGTVLTFIRWHERFFTAAGYFEGAKTLIPMGILLFFTALFLAADWSLKRRGREDLHSQGAALAMAAAAMGFAFLMLSFRQVADRYLLLYGFILLVQTAVVALVMLRPRLALAQAVAAMLAFAHLAIWSAEYLKPQNLYGALALYLVFGAMHTAVPVLLFRRQAGNGAAPAPTAPLIMLLSFLPFLLLVLALHQLPVPDPTPVFGVALALAVLLGWLSIGGKLGRLALVALFATLLVEAVWHSLHFRTDVPGVALGWYLGFHALFLAFPFVFRRSIAGQGGPWIASALSGAGHFLFVHDLVKRAFPNEVMGLLPAAFAVPALIALFAVTRMAPETERETRSRIAWFGGSALLFITLIFPIQFDRQWLTLSWALEGAALLWLFRRVPHPGLQLTGLALLAISFIRLGLNPAVFTDYPRGGTPILNWHLYVYGVVAAAQFAGGHWFTDPARRWTRVQPRGVLFGLGGILLFLLLNIEIADFFTEPGDRRITFRFGGNFARDMTYSIAWGLFSLALLGLGIWKRSKHARFAAIGLLAATLLKVFLHDLAAIESIFRIGALVGVALIAFIASFLYQKFFERTKPEP